MVILLIYNKCEIFKMNRQSSIKDFFKLKAKASASSSTMRKVSLVKNESATDETSDVVDLCSSESDTETSICQETSVNPVNVSQTSEPSSSDSQKTITYTPENVLDFKMDFDSEETIVLSPVPSPECKDLLTGVGCLEGVLISKVETIKDNSQEISKQILIQYPESNETLEGSSKTCNSIKTEDINVNISSTIIHQILQDVENTLQNSSKTNTPGLSMSKSNSSSKSENESLSQTIEKSVSSISQKTPQKSSTNGSKTPQSKSGGSSKSKYFSPAKKRNVSQKSPTKAKRNLTQEMEYQYLQDYVKREQLANGEDNDIETNTLLDNGEKRDSKSNTLYSLACQDMDDKTIFLLSTINDFIQNQNHHLLDTESCQLLLSCLSVVKPGMRLVCRFYWRKDRWYKRDQATIIAGDTKVPLNGEIFDKMIRDVIEKGLIDDGNTSNISFAELCSVLSVKELMEICKELKLKVSSKQEAMDALEKFSKRTTNIMSFLLKKDLSDNAELILSKMKAKAGNLYKLSEKARSVLDRLYMIMYLGINYEDIRDKKLELILLYDKIQRETYPVDKNMTLDNANIVFKTRDEFESYKTAHDIYEDFLSMTEVAQRCAVVKQVYRLYQDIGTDEIARYTCLPYWLRKYTAGGIYARMLNEGITELKKDADEGHYLLALNILDTLRSQDLFLQHKKADWYNEAALILDNKYHRYDAAAEVLLRGFNSDLPEDAKDTLRPRASKIAKQKNNTLSDNLRMDLLNHVNKEDALESSFGGQHIQKQPMERSKSRGKQRFETKTKDGRLIHEAEEFCICHYISIGEFTHGEHWEGRIITTIFTLLFWDIIYKKPKDAPGVFLSYYQKYPLDMFTDSFYENRKRDIDAWIDFIGQSDDDLLISIMQDTWNRRPEHELSGINRSIGWDNLQMVATCLGSRGLQAVCRRLALHYRHSSGFPDLTLWNVNTKRIKFVEVKTDFDKPSIKQLQWMKYLRESGIDTEFCYLGNDTLRQRSRRSIADRQSTPNKRTAKSSGSRATPKRRKKEQKPDDSVTCNRDEKPVKNDDVKPNSDDDSDAFEQVSSVVKREQT